MRTFLIIIIVIGAPILMAMTPERFSEIAGPLCAEYPKEAICKKWLSGQLVSGGKDKKAGKPATDSLTKVSDDWRWVEVPSSAMNKVHRPDVDEQWDYRGGAANSWRMIQAAWSGAAVTGSRMYLTGGGHADGAHNGVFSTDINGNWVRVTEPSPIWTEETCPNNTCTTDYGQCRLGTCTTGPDGAPVAVHSYNGLAATEDYLYRSGGSIWRHGTDGDGPRNFRLNLNSGQWSTFPESGWEKSTSNLVHVDGKLYLMTRKGIGIYDISSQKWEKRKGAEVVSARAKMIYDDVSDRFYVFGGGWAAWVEREKFGQEWHQIDKRPELLQKKWSLGVAKHNNLFVFWTSGPDLMTYDPVTDEWGKVTPKGTPGDGISAGPYGRFNVIGDRLVLVNGVSNNMFWLLAPGEVYTPFPPGQETLTDGQFANVDEAEPGIADYTTPGSGSLPDIELLASPYYDQPQPDILEQTCGPLDQWQVRDLTSDAQVEAQRTFSRGDRIIFNIHWKPEIYPALRIKGISCALVRGIKGPQGQLPKIRQVNMSSSSKHGIRQGGLQLQDLYISMYEAAERFGDVWSGDCIVMPNSSQFAIFRNIEVVGCQHHAFITSRAYSLYLEIADSRFQYAKSHLAYIDSVAMAYIHDSSFESPGWGHALRCIAGRCLIKDVKVSNINLDGSIAAPRGKNIIGMHPLEIYNCGGPHLVKDVDISFYRSREFLAASHASFYRTRDAQWGCNLGYHDGKQWFRFEYGTPEWRANNNWPRRELKYENVQVNCLTDTEPSNRIGCYGLGTWGSHPVAHDSYRNALQRWLRKNQFTTWDAMLDALESASLPYPTEWYKWTASRVFPEKRAYWLKGQYLNKWPVEPHPGAPDNLATVSLQNVSIINGLDSFVSKRWDSKRFCWSQIDNDGNCTDRKMPTAKIQLTR